MNPFSIIYAHTKRPQLCKLLIAVWYYILYLDERNE